LNISGGVYSDAGADVAFGANTPGTVNVLAGGTYNDSSGGGNVVYVGDSTGSLGTINIAGTFIARQVNIAQSETGVVNINGGSYSVTSATNGNGTFLGGNAGTLGTLNITAGTFTDASTTGTGIGPYGGTGAFNITGGTVKTTSFAIGGDYAGATPYTGFGTLYMNGSSAVAAVSGATNIGYTNGSTGTLTLANGTFNTSGATYVGNLNGSTGSLLLSNGAYNAIGATVIGNAGTGLINVTGGTYTGTGQVDVGSAATAKGTFNVSGGLVSLASNTLNVGDSGSGVLNVTAGTLNQSSGSATSFVATNSAGTGTVNISGGIFNAKQMYLGEYGTGVLNLYSGSYSGTSTGTYVSVFTNGKGTINVYGGSFTDTGGINLGYQGATPGTLNVSGGTVTTPTIYVGANGTSFSVTDNGLLNVSGTGAVNVGSGGIQFGQTVSAPTIVNQSGGSVTIDPTSVNGLDYKSVANSSQVYLLNGGTLTTNQIRVASGKSTAFNFSGGTLVTTANLTTNPTQTFPNSAVAYGNFSSAIGAGGATFNTSGNAPSWIVPLTQDPTSPGGGLTTFGGGSLTLTAANSYTGPTNVSQGTLFANSRQGFTGSTLTNSSTGTGTVTIYTGGILGGNGGTGAVVVSAGGTITAGATATTTGNLSTGSETWNSGGTFFAKFNGSSSTVSNNDMLVMSGLTVAATSGNTFGITLSNLSAGTITLTTASKIILADDTVAAGNPFNTASASATLAALTLTSTGVAAPAGYSLQLDTQGDGSTGYDLVVDVAATPEPTSLLLLGVAGAPLALARRRRAARRPGLPA
jgi:fibronectin-binding autotransporter adhesin